MDWRILYNPLAVLGKGKGFAVALGVIAILTLVAIWGGVHLDGALDLHVAPKSPSAGFVVAESLISWISLGVFLFLAAKMFGGNSGVGAHLGAAGLARFPYILAAIIVAKQTPVGKAMRAVVNIEDSNIVIHPEKLISPAMLIGAFAILALTVWSIVILYLGFSYASQIRNNTARRVGAFVIGLILAEVVSKVLLAIAVRM